MVPWLLCNRSPVAWRVKHSANDCKPEGTRTQQMTTVGWVATDGKIAELTLSRGKPGAWPGLSVQTVVGLSSDVLLLATTQHQEATDEQRQPTSC
jgi:hypothetical protein